MLFLKEFHALKSAAEIIMKYPIKLKKSGKVLNTKILKSVVNMI